VTVKAAPTSAPVASSATRRLVLEWVISFLLAPC
jgi:hypothetical protein